MRDREREREPLARPRISHLPLLVLDWCLSSRPATQPRGFSLSLRRLKQYSYIQTESARRRESVLLREAGTGTKQATNVTMDDAWYTTFVPTTAPKEDVSHHKRRASLLQQPNVSAIRRLHSQVCLSSDTRRRKQTRLMPGQSQSLS